MEAGCSCGFDHSTCLSHLALAFAAVLGLAPPPLAGLPTPPATSSPFIRGTAGFCMSGRQN